MKTLRMLFLFAGLSVLSASCSIFKKNKSGKLQTGSENQIAIPIDSASIQSRLLVLSLKPRLNQITQYALNNGFSTQYFFFIDMSISSGKNRFFVYEMDKDSVELEGLVSHGSCNTKFLEQARFSNTPNCGCSSLGKYKVGPSYQGEFGKAYRLYGLDTSNSNALKRGIVLHGFRPVPDEEIYPRALCNSFGCPMVSPAFLDRLSGIIEKSSKPILMWVYK
jgi:L,D-transpeptidase-like protein